MQNEPGIDWGQEQSTERFAVGIDWGQEGGDYTRIAFVDPSKPYALIVLDIPVERDEISCGEWIIAIIGWWILVGVLAVLIFHGLGV